MVIAMPEYFGVSREEIREMRAECNLPMQVKKVEALLDKATKKKCQ